MAKKEESIAVLEPAQIATSDYLALTLEPSSVATAIKENLGNDRLEAKDLDVVKIPAGGSLAWELPSLEGLQSVKEFSGIIIHWVQPRVFWESAFTGENNPPDCYSPDGIKGLGKPGGDCETCSFAQWGSGANNGQACRQNRQLFVLLPDAMLPIVVRLSPTSIAPCKKFFVQLASRSIPYSGVVTKFALEKDKSATNITYSRATFSIERKLEPEEYKRAQAFRAAIQPQLERAIILERE
jgi:hypothetical protein